MTITIQEKRDHCLKGQCNKIFDNFLSQTTRAPYEQAKNSLVIFFFCKILIQSHQQFMTIRGLADSVKSAHLHEYVKIKLEG